MKDARTRRQTGRTRPHPATPLEPRTGSAADGDDHARPAAPATVGGSGGRPDDRAEGRTSDRAGGRTDERTSDRAGGRTVVRAGGRPRDAAREAQIMAAAIDLVDEEGLPALTMDALAARAGASKATLYRRWPDRLVLAVALLDTLDTQRKPVADTGATREDLAALLRTRDAALQGPAGALLLGLAAQARRNPVLVEPLHRFMDAERAQVRSVLTRGVDRGELHGDADIAQLAATVAAAGLERALVASPPLTRRAATQLADQLLRAAHVDPAADTG